MQVNEIIKLSAIFAGEEEVANLSIFNVQAIMEPEEIPEISGDTEQGEGETSGEDVVQDDEVLLNKAKTFLQCLNLVLEDIARDYMPLLCEEEIVFSNKKFEYANLSKVIGDIIKLQATNGLAVKFKCFPTFIKADVKKAVLTYSYLPEKVDFNGIFNDFSSKLTERIIAYGVAMEYLFLNSLSDEAAVWENRFLNSLESALRKKHNISLPKRRWI